MVMYYFNEALNCSHNKSNLSDLFTAAGFSTVCTKTLSSNAGFLAKLKRIDDTISRFFCVILALAIVIIFKWLRPSAAQQWVSDNQSSSVNL